MSREALEFLRHVASRIYPCPVVALDFSRHHIEPLESLFEPRRGLISHEYPVVAIESTGVYWQPVHNVLESSHKVVLVNPRHIKAVPGRKTAISDSKWLAALLRHGLVKGSFIPPKEQRQCREVTRMRKSYVQTLGDFKRMVHALFHRANIKIDCVASDLFAATGLMILFPDKVSKDFKDYFVIMLVDGQAGTNSRICQS